MDSTQLTASVPEGIGCAGPLGGAAPGIGPTASANAASAVGKLTLPSGFTWFKVCCQADCAAAGLFVADPAVWLEHPAIPVPSSPAIAQAAPNRCHLRGRCRDTMRAARMEAPTAPVSESRRFKTSPLFAVLRGADFSSMSVGAVRRQQFLHGKIRMPRHLGRMPPHRACPIGRS